MSIELQPLFDYIDSNHQEFVRDLISICLVPAPSYQEEKRSQYFARILQDIGYDPAIDTLGNVIVPLFQNPGPRVVLSAHLDTVFSFQEIPLRQEGKVIYAPGISDDTSGLAGLAQIARAIRKCSVRFPGSLTFVATVGEEGLGNLRGVRHYFENAPRPDYFVSLDGADAGAIITAGIASKRVRITVKGPGGHSWGDAGTPNPVHHAGELLSHIHRLVLPEKPKTIINVGTIQGGTSVNAIPTEVTMDVDMRSENEGELRKLDASLIERVEAMQRWNISARIDVLGERPAGHIDPNHKLVQLTMKANKAFGLPAVLDHGSTDSNIPLSRGIPAVTTGVGGKSGKIHTPEEWYDPTEVPAGLKRTILLVSELLQA